MRSKRALLNLSSSFLRNFVGLGLGMVATPFLLKYLGEEQFAIFRVLSDWFSHLGLFEFGLFAAVMTSMAKVLGEKPERLGPALRSSFKKYLWVFALQVTALGLFACFFERLVPVSPEFQDTAWWCFFVFALSVPLVFSQVLKAYLEAAQKGFLVSYVMMLQNVLYLSLAIYFVFQGGSVLAQAAAFIGSFFFALLAYVWLCRRELLLVFKSRRDDSAEEQKHFNRQRTNLFLTELCGRVALMSDNLIITFVIGTREVTAFFLTQKLIQLVQQQLQFIGNSSWPALGELYYQKNLVIFRARVVELTEAVALFSGASLAALIIWNPAFVTLWTGEASFAGLGVSNLAAINGGFFALTSLWSWCFSATHQSHKLSKILMVQTVVNLIGSISLTYAWGLTGPLAGTLIGYIVIGVGAATWQLHRTFEISWMSLTRAWSVPFLIPAVVAMGGISYFGSPKTQSWLELLMALSATTLIIGVISYFVLTSSQGRGFLRERAKLLIHRRWRQ